MITVFKDRVKLCGRNKNVSSLNEDGVCKQRKAVHQHPKQEQFSKTGVRKQIAMASKRKHSTLTLKDKLEVLKRLDKGEGVTKLATEFNVGKATICDWRKNRRKLEQFFWRDS
ncbi:hypothetical protein TNCV_4838951 [Trichonephila clavipes]|nr:hypothetical protein TNCV_4838951 [Trichonephila clavipes]